MKVFLLIINLIPVLALADVPSAEKLAKILLPLKACPEKVWPGYTPLKDADFIINVPSQNKSLVIKEDGSITELASAEWGDEGLSPYSFGEKDGRKYLIANFDDYENEEQAIQTFFHEGFHYLGQKGIVPQTGRDELFPLDYEARVARAMQLRNMRDYLRDKKDESLHKASYWESWMKKHRPDEHRANQDWDVLEGSAEFVGLMSSAVSHLGCEATDDELLAKVLELSASENETSDRSGQSYNAGLMGYMVSRINQANEVFTKLNQSPLSAVLIDCPELEESPDESLRDTYVSLFSPIEEAVNKSVQELGESSGLIAIPREAMVGAFESMGFYSTLVNGARATVMPQTTMKISLNETAYSVQSKNLWEGNLRTVICGSSDPFFLIPKESLPELKELREDGEYLGKKLYCAEPMNP